MELILTDMNIKQVLVALGLVGLAVVVIINAGQFGQFIHLVSGLRWYVVTGIILVQLYSYYANAKYYQTVLNIFDHQLKVRRLYEVSLAVNFVNQILPAAGLAGAGFLSQATQPEVPRGEALLAQLLRQAFSALGVLLILPFGFVCLFWAGNVSQVTVRLMLILISAIITAALLLLMLVNDEALTRRLTHRLFAFANRSRQVKKRLPLDKRRVERFLEEFYSGYHILKDNFRAMQPALLWSVAYILIEVLTIWLVFLAFGHLVNPGVVIAAYTLSNIASIGGGLISSIGVFEASMVGALVALGSSFSLAFSVTVVYRVLNMLIGLPPGVYFYRKYIA